MNPALVPEWAAPDYADLADLIRPHLDGRRLPRAIETPRESDAATLAERERLLTIKCMGAPAPFVGDPRTTFAYYEWRVAVEGDRPVVTGAATLYIEQRVRP